MRPGRIAYVTCPRCRALNTHGVAECFLCEMRLAGLRADVPPADSGPTFRLATLMLAVALIAGFLGFWRFSPGLAALSLVPGSIALVRAFVLSGERYGRPPSTWEYFWAFLVTFAFVVLVMASSAIAFLATCFAIVGIDIGQGRRENGAVALIAGLIAAVIVPAALLIVAAVRRGTRFRNRPPSGKRD